MKLRLTSAEMSMLWAQYMNDTASVCVLSHFSQKAEDEEAASIIQYALTGSKSNIAFLQELFMKENFPVPHGFKEEEDVQADSPRLFSDTYATIYLRNMSLLGMTAGSVSLGLVTRPDIVRFFKNVLKTSVGLQDLTRDLMLKEGTYIKLPYISTPDEGDCVDKQRFLSDFFGEKRPLTALEITMLFNNIQTNSIGKTLIIGFAQTAQDSEVKQYFLRGRKIAQKHIDIFSDILKKEDLPAPMTWDTAVSDTTEPVFSDKLMMFHVSAMIASGIGNYGASMSGSPRYDLGFRYASLIPEIALYAEDGANIMIKNSWLEEPPQSDPRERLIKGE